MLSDSELPTELNEQRKLYIRELVCKKNQIRPKGKPISVETSAQHKDIQDFPFTLINFSNNYVLHGKCSSLCLLQSSVSYSFDCNH